MGLTRRLSQDFQRSLGTLRGFKAQEPEAKADQDTHEERRSDSFAMECMLDAMERGAAPESTTTFVEPEQKTATQRRMKVSPSEDRTRHTLYDEEGNVVMTACAVLAQRRIEFFTGERPSVTNQVCGPAAPAFAMTFDESRTRWRLSCCGRCERCVYRYCSCESLGGQTLANLTHLRQTIGGGVARCMELDIPEVAVDGNAAVWCPLQQAQSGGEARATKISSKRPRWNSSLESLVMDFNGRCSQSSERNFQLCIDGDVVLTFGKRGENLFCLDFEHPLSVVQAFAAAMSTAFWT